MACQTIQKRPPSHALYISYTSSNKLKETVKLKSFNRKVRLHVAANAAALSLIKLSV